MSRRQTVPVWEEYRPIGGTIQAFCFDGTFPLDFLRANETVRRASAGSCSIVVAQGEREVLVNRGDYLVRDLKSGVLRKEGPQGFADRWEQIVPAEAMRSAS